MSPSRKKPETGTVITSNATRLPRQRGVFAQAEAPEPVTPKPRRRLGEPLKGVSVTVTGPKATTTTNARGGSA